MGKKRKKLGKVNWECILKSKKEGLNGEEFEPMVDDIMDIINRSKKYKNYKITLKIEGK